MNYENLCFLNATVTFFIKKELYVTYEYNVVMQCNNIVCICNITLDVSALLLILYTHF